MPKKKPSQMPPEVAAALKTTEGWRLTPNELHNLENFHRCAQCDLDQAIHLLKAALPILQPDAPCRWYKNDKVRDDIRKFLGQHGVDVNSLKE